MILLIDDDHSPVIAILSSNMPSFKPHGSIFALFLTLDKSNRFVPCSCI